MNWFVKSSRKRFVIGSLYMFADLAFCVFTKADSTSTLRYSLDDNFENMLANTLASSKEINTRYTNLNSLFLQK